MKEFNFRVKFKPSLNNGWLSDVLDAHSELNFRGFSPRLRVYSNRQKDILDILYALAGEPANKGKTMFILEGKSKFKLLIEYLDLYPLATI